MTQILEHYSKTGNHSVNCAAMTSPAAASRALSLAQLVALTLPPPAMVRLAAGAGCQATGLRLAPTAPGGPFHALVTDAALRRETRAALADTGVAVLDIEVVRLGAAFDAAELAPLLATSAELGARHLLVAGDDPDEARLTASFAVLCEAAAAHGLTAELEFMPWTAVPDLGTAARIVERAAHPAGGVLIDALHFGRSASTRAQVAALPRHRLRYAQICDGAVPPPATVEGLIHDARRERLLPGDGGIDLVGLFAALPADLPVAVEVPSESRLAALGAEAWAALAVAAARRVLALADEARHG